MDQIEAPDGPLTDSESDLGDYEPTTLIHSNAVNGVYQAQNNIDIHQPQDPVSQPQDPVSINLVLPTTWSQKIAKEDKAPEGPSKS